MLSNVEALDMFPSESRSRHGPLSLGRVRVACRSPASSLVRGPPTPLRHRSGLRSSLAVDLPRRECFSEPAPRAFADVRRGGGSGTGSSAAPVVLVDSQGHAWFMGHPLRSAK